MNQLKRFLLEQVDRQQLTREDAFGLAREIMELELQRQTQPPSTQSLLDAPAVAAAAEVEPIAIVGLACRVPKADTPDQFWQNLVSGVDAVGPFPRERLEDVIRTKPELWEKYRAAALDGPVLQGGWLEGIDGFDPEAFGVHDADATTLGPAERLFLMTGWEALESAGCTRQSLNGAQLGIYLAHSPEVPFEYARLLPDGDPQAIPFNNPGTTGYRLAYWLNTRGPTMVVNTTCSSSLVATHVACQALRNGDCELALCGGLSFYLFPFFHDTSDPMRLLAKDGRCKAFDAAADGLSMGEGVILFVLKRLSRAQADGDFVYATIRGSGVSSDGRSNGTTAPNPEAQTDAIVRAWQQARIDPRRLGYVEGHGAGTKLGDPIEVKGLSDAFRRFTQDRRFCALGSVKASISHLGDAAGAAGLLKVVLSLYHKTLAPTLHFQRENPLIPFESSPLFVQASRAPWETHGGPRLGGVSSFGISGTNSHMVVEEFVREPSPARAPSSPSVLTISARTLNALWRLLARYEAYLGRDCAFDLDDVCYSSLLREPACYRAAFVAESVEEMRQKLARMGELRHLERLPAHFQAQGIFAARVDGDKSELYSALPIDDGSPAAKLVRSYLQQAHVPAERFYQPGTRRRVPLPNTPFTETRCWPAQAVPREERYEQFFYEPCWVEKARLPGGRRLAGKWLVLGDEDQFTRELVSQLTARGAGVVVARAGERLERHSESEITLDPTVDAHFDRLAEELRLDREPLAGVVHAWTCRALDDEMSSFEALTVSQQRTSIAVFKLVRALSRHGFDCNADFAIVTAYAHAVDGSEPGTSPARVTACGVGKVLSQEHPLIRSLALDLDIASLEPESAAAQVLDELELDRSTYDELVAYRSGRRWVQQLGRPSNREEARPVYTPRAGGVYVLAGGTGALGLELGVHLARQQPVKIVLLSRTPLPPRDGWQSDTLSAAQRAITGKISEMERMGAEVLHICTDVTDPVQVESAFGQIRTGYGRVDGVVVAMKYLAHQPLLTIPEEEFVTGIMNRVQGTWLLDRATAGDHLDFFLMLSSISSLMGTKTAAECCAVNQYLDQFPAYLSKQGRAGMSMILTLILDDLRDFRGPSPIPPLDFREFLGCFDEFMRRRPSVAVVAKFDHDEVRRVLPVLKLRFSPELSDEMGVAAVEAEPAIPGESVGGLSSEPRAADELGTKMPAGVDLEGIVTGMRSIWKEVIGYSGPALDDSFFALGGTSLTVLRLIKMMRDTWPVRMEVSDVYANPTIRSLAQHVHNAMAPAEDPLRQAIRHVAEESLDVESVLRAMERSR